MSKAHIFAPLKWVKEQFKKVNADVTALNSEIEELNSDVLPLGTYNIGVVFSKYANYSCKAPTSILKKDRYVRVNSADVNGTSITVQIDVNGANLSFYTMSDVSNEYGIINITVT